MRGIINISLSPSKKWSVSSSITHPNILLTYHILIEVTPIVAQIIICKISLVFAERDTMSSKKLTSVIIPPNQSTSQSL